jgi:predicted small secreted protein
MQAAWCRRTNDGGIMLIWSRYLRTMVFGLIGLALIGSGIACNTMEGAGKDVERAGEAVQDAADDARD